MALISGKVIGKMDCEAWTLNPLSWWRSFGWIQHGLQDAPEDD
jgi:hypothetical protein